MELHREVVGMLRRDPSLLSIAKDNINRWLAAREIGERDPILEWKEILGYPFQAIIKLLESEDEEACRLRQSSPFAGVLPENVRREIFHRYATLRT
ncbi:MAG: hypothetical protein LBK76_00110 [Verrucomicrobiales bacterium]|nr:hypothetical protein [Verrucomicrobiales bacterium]